MEEGGSALLRVPGVRHKKQDGTLHLTSSEIGWSEESSGLVQISFPYHLIKCQRVSAESSSKVQLQLILHNGASYNFHFTGDSARQERNQVKELLQRLLSGHAVANSELQAKSSLLRRDSSLHQLYKDLVGRGIITPEEFWANRLNKEQDGKSGEKQLSGLPSAFLADVQAEVDGCNAVKYNLTADTIEAIFRTYPSVKAKHSELVPDKMSEESFWVQFFQSQLFHRDASSSSLLSSSTTSDLFSECLRKETKDIDEKKGASSKLGAAIGLFEDKEEGYGPSSSNSEAGPVPSELVLRCNHHSHLLLRALEHSPVADQEDSAARMDREQSKSQLFVLSASQSDKTELSSDVTQLVHTASQFSNWTLTQNVDIQSAHSALGYLVPGGALMPTDVGGAKLKACLSSETQASLVQHQAALSELLRHFWACFPTVSAQLEEKVQRMAHCLEEYRCSQLVEFERGLAAEEKPLVVQLEECVRLALERYQAWQARTHSYNRT